MVDITIVSRPFNVRRVFTITHTAMNVFVGPPGGDYTFTIESIHSIYIIPVTIRLPSDAHPERMPLSITRGNDLSIRAGNMNNSAAYDTMYREGNFFALGVPIDEPQARPALWLFQRDGRPLQIILRRVEITLMGADFIYMNTPFQTKTEGILFISKPSRSSLRLMTNQFGIGTTLTGRRADRYDIRSIMPSDHHQTVWETIVTDDDIRLTAPGGIWYREGLARHTENSRNQTNPVNDGTMNDDELQLARRTINEQHNEFEASLRRPEVMQSRVRDKQNVVLAYWNGLTPLYSSLDMYIAT